jgi:hypothetical protein
MDAKINIAKILKDKPEGTKLWTDMFGSVTLYVVTDTCDAFQVKHHNKEPWFDKEGKLYKEGGLCIYPSKFMRDWFKFAWKKGDVLIRTNSEYCIGIFEEWTSDDYSTFSAKYINLGLSDNFSCSYTCKTEEWETENSKNYISEIERVMNGKLNLQTLEIQTQPEFKDGDIVVYGESVAICRRIYKHTLSFYVSLNEMFGLLFADEVESSEEYRFATDEDKQQLFDALAKEGKAWDAEKKQIVDIKKEHQFKPFEKVLVRDSIDDVWRASFFSHIKENDGRYVTTCVTWKFCIPYIGNESLVGTTKDVEG